MHTNHKREDPLVEMGYEVRDIDMPKIKKTVYIFFGFAIFCIVFAGVALLIMDPGYIRGESGYQTPPRIPPAPNPLVQTNVTAKTDIIDMRRKEFADLTSTGYVNPEKTKVHIPIDRAIDIMAQRGVPKGVETTAVTRGTTNDEMRIDPTESVDAARTRMEAAEAAAVEAHGAVGSNPAPGSETKGN